MRPNRGCARRDLSRGNGVTVPPLVQTLPFVAWILLATLGVGSFAFAVATRALSDATTGYVRFVAFTAAAIMLLPVVMTGDLMASDALAVKTIDASDARLLTIVLAIFIGIALVYAYAVGRVRTRALSTLGAIGAAAGLVALATAAVALAQTPLEAVPLLVQLAMLSFVTGGSVAAVVLGHWYLVTPKISARPLLLQTRMLLAGLIVAALLFVVWTTLGGGPEQRAFTSFTTGPVLLVVLRVVVTLAFPIVLCLMAWRTAQTRSMESATGLLYINLAAVLAGTIGAAALYVSSGILV